jgi:peptidoglycan/LPS O-acetylase OafA/YrhL
MSESSWKVSRVIRGRGKPLNALAVGLLLAGLVAADYGAFQLFDRNYFDWYISNGSLIALAVAVVAVAVELDQRPSLISARPGVYLGAWVEIPGETLLSFSDLVRGVDPDPDAGPLDALITGVVAIIFAGLWLCWLVVIAPLQYFVTLLAGAPARRARASGRRTWVERRSGTTVIGTGPIEQMPNGSQEIGLARRPVSATSTLTAALLFAVSQYL